MKFTIFETELKTVRTEREIELDFPHYFKVYDSNYLNEWSNGHQIEIETETLGVINRSNHNDTKLDIWQISFIIDRRNEIDKSWKIQTDTCVSASFVTEEIIRYKIPKEIFLRDVSEMLEDTKSHLINQ
jgi:hypothetical protein